MAIIRPVSDLQRHTGEISRLARESDEPIYLTYRGSNFLVLVDADRYEELERAAKRSDGKGDVHGQSLD